MALEVAIESLEPVSLRQGSSRTVAMSGMAGRTTMVMEGYQADTVRYVRRRVECSGSQEKDLKYLEAESAGSLGPGWHQLHS